MNNLIWKDIKCRRCHCTFTFSIKEKDFDTLKKEYGQNYVNSKTHYCEKCWKGV